MQPAPVGTATATTQRVGGWNVSYFSRVSAAVSRTSGAETLLAPPSARSGTAELGASPTERLPDLHTTVIFVRE